MEPNRDIYLFFFSGDKRELEKVAFFANSKASTSLWRHYVGLGPLCVLKYIAIIYEVA